MEKNERRKDFYKSQLIQEAKEKLNRKDFIALSELLNKLNVVKRNGEV